MSILTKMVSLLNRSPKVSHIQAKTINLYFSNSIDNKYSVLNIDKYQHYDFEVVASQEEKDNVFKLVANLYDGKSEVFNIATFETRREAEDALLSLRNKLYSTEKKLVKLVILLIILNVIFGTLTDFAKILYNRPASVSQSAGPSEEEFNRYQEQMRLLQAQPNTAPQAVNVTPPAQVEQEANPEVNSFLNKLN